MLRRTFKKPICFLLALFMIFTLTACNDNPTEPLDTKDTSEAEAAPAKEFTPSEKFVIVRSDLYAADADIVDACYYVRKAFEAAYGYKMITETDATEYTADRYEILIGVTNRKQSKAMFSGLSINDYGYSIPSEKTIVICGATPDQTMKAVEKFCHDILGYDGKKVEEKNPIMTTKTQYLFEDSYQ